MQTAVDPLLGQVLEGRYRILARLAVGGMSTVYAAVDERLDREVAVKVMNRTLSEDPAFVDRFAREARAAARLSHVNAVAVYDQGSDAGNVFLVMELVRGRTLRDLLRERGILSPAEAVSLMRPVLLALAAAHQAGLVHRDVKPENILLSDSGVVKVADFGLARADETSAASTRTGLMMGTVAYSSPEQFRGSPVDKRSDVYSAGIVLFELLTGAPPYQGPDAMSVAYQHVHHDVPPPSSRQRGIAPPLDHVVQRATARDPARRPADAGSLLAGLQEVQDLLRLPVMPVPSRPRPARAHPPQSAGQASARTGPVAGVTQTARLNHAMPNGRLHPTMVEGREPPAGPAPSRRPPIGPPVNGSRRDASRHRRRTLVIAVLVLLLCAALIAGSWWFAKGRWSQVDDVRSQSVAAATAQLRKDGFSVTVDPAQASDSVPAGQVLSTDPPGGGRQVRGRTVHIVPSSGPTYYQVPSVKGQTRAAATAALAALQSGGVTVTYVQQANDTVANGAVIVTNPVAGTKVKRGDTVTVTVSTGPPILSVPDVGGKSQDDATTTLTGVGFKVSAVQAFSDTVASGQVISQNPVGNSQLRKFSTVSLTVSKGPDLVAVPSLPSLDDIDDATSRMQAAGFVVSVEKAYGGIHGLVVGIDPIPGTMAHRGSTVTLTIV